MEKVWRRLVKAIFDSEIMEFTQSYFLISSLPTRRLNLSHMKQSYYASLSCVSSYFGALERTQ